MNKETKEKIGIILLDSVLKSEKVSRYPIAQSEQKLFDLIAESNREYGLELLEKAEAAKCESLDKSDPSLWGEEYTALNRHHTQLFNDGVDKTIQVIKSQIEKENGNDK